MKSLSSVFPSVTKFSQDSIIIFFLILYIMKLAMISSVWLSQIFEKKKNFGGSNMGQMGRN